MSAAQFARSLACFLLLGLVLATLLPAAHNVTRPDLSAPSGDSDARVIKIDDEENQSIQEIDTFKIPTANGVVARLNFSPDGKWLLVCDYRAVHLWDLTGELPREASSYKQGEFHLRDILSAAISPDGSLVALGGFDKGVHLCAVKEMRLTEISNEMEHDSAVRALQFSPDGKTLLSGGDDAAVIVWDVRKDKLHRRTMAKIENAIFGVQGIGFAGNSKNFYVDTAGGDVREFALGGGEPKQIKAFKEPEQFGLPMAVSADGRQIAFGSLNDVILWNGKDRPPFPKHTAKVNDVAFSPDAKLIASGGEDGRLIIWDPTGRIKYSTQRPNPFDAVAFRPGRGGPGEFWIAAANRNGTVFVMHLRDTAAKQQPAKNQATRT